MHAWKSSRGHKLLQFLISHKRQASDFSRGGHTKKPN